MIRWGLEPTIKDAYFTEAVSTNLTKISGWEDVDRIEVSSILTSMSSFHGEMKRLKNLRRFAEEVSMDNGNWYHEVSWLYGKARWFH